MKVLICNTLESKGGAAKAAYRIYESVKQQGVDAIYVYKYKDGAEAKSIIPKIDAIPKYLFSNNRKIPFSTSIFSFGGQKLIKKYNPDIVHLNYINMGMFSIKEIGQINKPVVWTIHDSWAFTGGCHLPNDCQRYKNSCGNCPALESKKIDDLSNFVLNQKLKYWKGKNIHLVCPSKWIMSKAKESPLFEEDNIHLIPNPINTDIFKPMDKRISRQKYNLRADKHYILFGSINPFEDPNKGFHLLIESLKRVKTPNIELLVFGSQTNIPKIKSKFPIKNIGFIKNENDLAYLYSAVDITVNTSISENLPNTIIESLACGTPCIGFRIGGIPDIINNKILGKTVSPFNVLEFASSIDSEIGKESINKKEISKNIEKRFGYNTISKEYLSLYQSLTL